MMTCERAAVVLRGLEKNELSVTSPEVEELLALGLAVEAMPEDLAIVSWLRPIVREYAHTEIGDPNAIPTLSRVLRETEEELKKDWYRIKTSKEELARREASRVMMRRALVYLSDPRLVTPLMKVVVNGPHVAPEAQYVCCPQLGMELYAMTHKGWRVRRALRVRMDRVRAQPLGKFVHSFDKTEAKMRAFSEEVRKVSNDIGYVRKNREQVVIGLMKTGKPGPALDAYLWGKNNAVHPDVAVVCARNTERFGRPDVALARLRDAEAALLGAGYPSTPIVLGAAKSLLAFDPISKGLQRYVELMQGLQTLFVGWGNGRQAPEMHFKYAARLMAAQGMPAKILERVAAATEHLRRANVLDASCRDPQGIAIAIAAMVPAPEKLPELVQRFAAVKHELLRAGVSVPHHVDNDALECVACPGSPEEVVDSVSALMRQLAAGRQPGRADVAVAAAFAKRFAY